MLNTASSMYYYGKLREGQRQTSLTREGLFCIRKNRCLDPPQPVD